MLLPTRNIKSNKKHYDSSGISEMLPLCLKREAVLLAIFFASDDNLVKVLRKLLPNMVRLFMMLYESSGITAVIPKRTLNSTFLTNQPEIKNRDINLHRL